MKNRVTVTIAGQEYTLVGTEEAGAVLAQSELSASDKAQALVDQLTGGTLTAGLLNDAGVTASSLLNMMRSKLSVPASFSLAEARLVLGVQYELSLRKADAEMIEVQ